MFCPAVGVSDAINNLSRLACVRKIIKYVTYQLSCCCSSSVIRRANQHMLSNSLSLASLSMTHIELKKKKKYHSEEHATVFLSTV